MGQSGRIDNRFVNQHNWNVVPNGIHAATLAALQALSFVLQSERFLADRANQHIQQILRNHDADMLTPARQHWSMNFYTPDSRILADSLR
jgi:hypothetical protein